MTIKTSHIDGLENREIKVKEEKKVTYPFDLWQPFARIAITGASGSGKTNAFINAWEKMYPYIDKTVVISPTLSNDIKQKQAFMGADGKGRENVMVFDEPSIELLKDIYDELKRISKDYQDSIKTRQAYERWKKLGYDVDKLQPKDLIMLDRIDYDLSNLTWTKTVKPNIVLFIDDCQSYNDILKSKMFESMVIKLRHFNTNLFVNIQTFKGLGVNSRRNMTGFMVFKTIDKTLLKSIFEETQMLWKSFDDFIEQYEFATENNHDFLYIDTMDKKYPVRKNFNTPIQNLNDI